MRTHCIYKITNTQNGKYYVGRAKDFKVRKYGHFSALRQGKHKNHKLQASFNKWGEDCFRMDAQVTGLTESEAKELEQLCLDEVVGMHRCYNISKSAEAPDQTGFKHSDETKRKIGDAFLGKKHCDKTKRKIAEALRGKPKSEKHKRKISEARLGKKLNEETKRKLSKASNCPNNVRKQRESKGKPFVVTWPCGRSKSYLSLKEAAPELGVSHVTIDRYLKGTSTPGTGQRWKKSAHLVGCTFTYTKEQQ